MPQSVDVVVLSRDLGPLDPRVERGIASQQNVAVRLHRVLGTPRAQDGCRWASIVNARNRGKRLGTSPWLMFLDDDIVISPSTVSTLLEELKQQPIFGAMAADALGDTATANQSDHVGVGVTLFRRSALDRIEFRWEPQKCECLCACEDLRHQMIGIGYANGLTAEHIEIGSGTWHQARDRARESSPAPDPAILCVVGRHNVSRFSFQFVPSLRAAGNEEQVVVLAYGLPPSQQRSLRHLANVQVWPYRRNGPEAAMLKEESLVGDALTRLDPRTPLATWSAGKTIFQHRLTPLWERLEAAPGSVLVTDIAQVAGQEMTHEIFFASTAGTMQSVLDSGTSTWLAKAITDDLRENPHRFKQIPQAWNYPLLATAPGCFEATGRFDNGESAFVLHADPVALATQPGYEHLVASLGTARAQKNTPLQPKPQLT